MRLRLIRSAAKRDCKTTSSDGSPWPVHGPVMVPSGGRRPENKPVTEVYIDADGCPVKEEVYRVARRKGIVVHVVSNARMNVPADERIRRVVVANSPEAADDWIAEHAGAGDVVVTTDIPLADRCLKRGAKVLDPKGNAFTEDSIGGAVAMRDLMRELRAMDLTRGGPAPFTDRDRSRFVSRLHEVIQAAGRPSKA